MKSRIVASLPFVFLGVLLGMATALAQTPRPVASPPAVMSASSPHGDLKIDCSQCHVTESWRKWPDKPGFRHEQTGFPLKQAHAQAKCLSCHKSLEFSRVPTSCADCHRDPHQAALGFECQSCHAPTTWTNQRDLRDAHEQTRFPLFGAHARLDCTACHRKSTGGGPTGALSDAVAADFAGTPADCLACHLSDYQRASNPNHVGGGFSRRCTDCHGAHGQTWTDVSAFPHPAFPINSGPHQGTWTSCNTCHTTGSFRAFDCTVCHEHRRSEMDDEHDDVRGYVYQSPACYACHPRGVE
jgi:hypothetical protein